MTWAGRQEGRKNEDAAVACMEGCDTASTATCGPSYKQSSKVIPARQPPLPSTVPSAPAALAPPAASPPCRACQTAPRGPPCRRRGREGRGEGAEVGQEVIREVEERMQTRQHTRAAAPGVHSHLPACFVTTAESPPQPWPSRKRTAAPLPHFRSHPRIVFCPTPHHHNHPPPPPPPTCACTWLLR